MNVLNRKIRRDLARQRWQYISIGVTVFVGLAMFAASYDAYLNLERSYQRTYDRLNFADLTITGGDGRTIADELAGRDGVALAATRRKADAGIRIGGGHTLLGHLLEVPDGDNPSVNQVDVATGDWPVDSDSVLLERHLADHFDLGPGNEIEVYDGSSWRTLVVSGSAVSPEYIWPARSRQDVLTSSDDFGVIFAPTLLFDEIAVDPVDQTLVRYRTDAATESLTAALVDVALELGAASTLPAAEQPSNAALQEDVAGFGELAFLFPVLFLGAAAMATFILLSRVVRAQRAQIATLRANGVATGQVVTHYLGTGMVVTGLAGAAGLAVGVITGRLVTGIYTEAISVPDTVTGLYPVTVATGFVLAILTGLVAAVFPALAAARTPPAAALRGVQPAGSGGRSTIERIVPALGRLPARWRMVVRGIGRDHRRSLSTAVGVILAVTLILASWGMVDTVEILLDRQFNVVQRQDAQVHLDATVPTGVEAISRLDGVDALEEVVQAPVVVSAGDRRYATELLAFEPDTAMHDFGTARLRPEGMVAGRSLAALLDVTTGDRVTVARTDGSGAIDVPIAGFVDEPLGTFVFTTRDTAAPLAANQPTTTLMVTFAEGVDRDVMRRTITDTPGVVAYVDSKSLYETAQDLLSLFYAFVGVMLLFGSLMAFALIFNTATVNTAERSAELAAMEVNGASPGQLARLLAGETLLLTVVSLVPGVLIGYGVSAVFMDSFSSDLFDFGLEVRARTLVLVPLIVLAFSAFAQWPASRSLRSLDVARVVREQAQ